MCKQQQQQQQQPSGQLKWDVKFYLTSLSHQNQDFYLACWNQGRDSHCLCCLGSSSSMNTRWRFTTAEINTHSDWCKTQPRQKKYKNSEFRKQSSREQSSNQAAGTLLCQKKKQACSSMHSGYSLYKISSDSPSLRRRLIAQVLWAENFIKHKDTKPRETEQMPF